MSAKVYVGSSGIHGRGVFARHALEPGELVGRYASRKTKLTAEDHPHVMELYDDDGELLECRMGVGELRFVNHSSSPNLELDDETLEFRAVRQVEPGDELTWYYGDEFEADPG
jgi:SET domain-containing protein